MKGLPIAAATLLVTWACAAGAAEAPAMEPANNDVADIASLQRGAKYFVNYCLGCHSAKYVRYNRLGEDLGLTEAQLVDNLMFTGERPFDTMDNAMREEDGARWFGRAPPDLSLIARSRGPDYLYNYLKGFYEDDSTATGANNLVLPNASMPDVFWEVQGIRRAVPVESEMGADGGSNPAGAVEGGAQGVKLEVVQPGTLTEAQFDQMVRDIVNFLDYIGEPMQLERRALGIRVIAFLLVFLLVAYLLKKEIWKDVT
jgi:ubiquinol-cytochrome c reductase cytochrome c1 subunit